MTITAGLDVGSTYSKAIIQDEDGEIVGRAMGTTGFRLREMARQIYDEALEDAGVAEDDISYVIATGAGRHQVDFKNLQLNDLLACARRRLHLRPQPGQQSRRLRRRADDGHRLASSTACRSTGAWPPR